VNGLACHNAGLSEFQNVHAKQEKPASANALGIRSADFIYIQYTDK
jgi:hypothetical protein